MVDLDALPRADRKLLGQLAEAAGVSSETMAEAVVRAYLGLVRDCPAALPADPLRSLSVDRFTRKGERT